MSLVSISGVTVILCCLPPLYTLAPNTDIPVVNYCFKCYLFLTLIKYYNYCGRDEKMGRVGSIVLQLSYIFFNHFMLAFLTYLIAMSLVFPCFVPGQCP